MEIFIGDYNDFSEDVIFLIKIIFIIRYIFFLKYIVVNYGFG